MTEKADTNSAAGAIYVRFSDDGTHIRKWAREPFEEAIEYLCAAEWIPHDGGDCPVPPETRVLVRYRDGSEEYEPEPASYYTSMDGGSNWWKHEGASWGANDGHHADIIAYRVVRS